MAAFEPLALEEAAESFTDEPEPPQRGWRSRARLLGALGALGVLAAATHQSFGGTSAVTGLIQEDLVEEGSAWDDAPLVVTSFIPYYVGGTSFKVKGHVGISGGGATDNIRVTQMAFQELSWWLDGVDERCEDGPSTAANSCGVIIHNLLPSSTPAHPCSQLAGSNFFGTSPDPWLKIAYTSSASGFTKAKGVRVTTNEGVWSLLNKVVLVHDYEGKPIACGAIEPPCVVADILPVNTTCHASVLGEVKVTGRGQGTDGAKQVLSWNLAGVDRRCSLEHCDDPFACKVVIHTGTCANLGAPFPNLPEYEPVANPWAGSSYGAGCTSAYGCQESVVEEQVVSTGQPLSRVLGLAVAVYNADGKVAGCGVLGPRTLVARDFNVPQKNQTPEYTQGVVTVTGGRAGSKLFFDTKWQLTQADPRCVYGQINNLPSCSVGLFASTNCSGSSLLNNTQTPIVQTPSSTLACTEDVRITTSRTTASAGKTFTTTNANRESTALTTWQPGSVGLFNQKGQLASCSRIIPYCCNEEPEEPEEDAGLVVTSFISCEYSACAEDYKVEGSMTIGGGGVSPVAAPNPTTLTAATAYQVLSWDLKHVDARCATGPSSSASSCGIQIHHVPADATPAHPCSQPPGPTATALSPDAWKQITYTSTPSSEEECSETRKKGVKVTSGVEVPDLVNAFALVYDKAGDAIACGAIEPRSVVAKIAPAPGYEGSLQVTGTVRVRGEGQGTYGAKQLLSWDLHGADPKCRGECEGGNACRVIIFTGTCSNLGVPFPGLEPKYQPIQQPWKQSVYSGAEAEAEDVVIPTGQPTSRVLSRAVAVFDAAGAVAGCGLLGPESLVAKSFDKNVQPAAPEYTAGVATLSSKRSIELDWALTQADPSCSPSKGTSSPSCSLGVFASRNCDGVNLLQPAPLYSTRNTLSKSEKPEATSIQDLAEAGTWTPVKDASGALTANTAWTAGAVGVFNSSGALVSCSRLSFSSCDSH